MSKKFFRVANAIMFDKWSDAFIILMLLLLVLFSISEKLYAGGDSTLIAILLTIIIICLIARWVYLLVRSLRAYRNQIEDSTKELNTRSKQGDVIFFLSFISFLIIIWYLDKNNLVLSWVTAILTIFFGIGAVAALVRRPR